MRLESALYSSWAGLDSNGKAVAVTGDNIANVNTTGYKQSRPEFVDLFAEGPEGHNSSGEPAIGNGSAIGTVRVIHQPGSIEFTGRTLDIAIDGNGFFLTGTAANPSFNRSGILSINKDGFLVNQQGEQILGFTPTDTTGTTLTSLNISGATGQATPTTTASILGNINSTSAINTAVTNPATFSEINAVAASIAQVTSYDSLGAPHPLFIAFTKTGVNQWTAQAFIDGDEVGGTDGVPTLLGSAQMTFDSNGTIPEASKAAAAMTLAPAYAGGAAAGSIALDLSGFTQFAASNNVTSINQNGKSVGSVTGYQFDKTGGFYAVVDDGSQIKIGTVALGTVRSVDNLQRTGDTTYVESDGTGERQIGFPGANGLGGISQASLERSTVDLAGQFVDLLLFQRGYQANSKTLSTAADMLRETIALIR